MPKFVIERDQPSAGSLTTEVRTVAAQSNDVLADMAPRAHWLPSYVTTDKVRCASVAEDEVPIRQHADCVGVPVSAVDEITSVLDPTSGV